MAKKLEKLSKYHPIPDSLQRFQRDRPLNRKLPESEATNNNIDYRHSKNNLI